MSKFVIDGVVQRVWDGIGPHATYLSTEIDDDGDLRLIVGAEYKHGTACLFGKDSLGKLIEILTEIKNAEWK